MGLLWALVLVAGLQAQTPVVDSWERLGAGNQGWVLVGDPVTRGAGWGPGIALTCGTAGVEFRAYFGPFPSDGRPVQLAVRLPDGRIERAGPVLRGGRATGFHDPELLGGPDARRIADAALVRGALVSNGYFSFYNGVSEASNRQVRGYVLACGG